MRAGSSAASPPLLPKEFAVMATETKAPWHAGEVAMQQTVGVADRMAAVGGKVVRDFMPDQHRDFYEQLPFIVMGAVDPQGAAIGQVLAVHLVIDAQRHPAH